MKRLAGCLGAAALAVGAVAVPPALSQADDSANFSAEVFAAPSYHLTEIPKLEEGGEGFSWAYVNQTPESWGRSLAFWPGPTPDTAFATSTPQVGPLEGHRWKSPGAWQSYPSGGETGGEVNFGEPAKIPFGTTAQTPGGNFEILSATGRASAERGEGTFTYGGYQGASAPVQAGFGQSMSEAHREEGAAVATGVALLRNVRLGDVTIDEIRGESSVRATANGDQANWKLTIAGLSTPDQTFENLTFSSAEGGDKRIETINQLFAGGAEQRRSEFVIVPGRIWKDEGGTHAVSGFLRMAHSPIVTENSLFQKMGYAFSFTSARAIYLGGSASDAPSSTEETTGSENEIEIGEGGSSDGSGSEPTTAQAPPSSPFEAILTDSFIARPPSAYAPSLPLFTAPLPTTAGPGTADAPGGEVELAAPLPPPAATRASPAPSPNPLGSPATLQALGISVGEAAGREASRVMGGLAFLGLAAVLFAIETGRRQLALSALQRKPR